MKLHQLVSIIDATAPFRLAESWDNVGLQIGNPDAVIERVLVALEVTPAIIAEAKAKQIQAIVTHHPLIFAPLRNLAETNVVSRMVTELIRAEIALIAAHTNLDAVAEGTNGEIADRLQLSRRRFLRPIDGEDNAGIGMLGHLERSHSLGEFAALCRQAFEVQHLAVVGTDEQQIQRVAVCSGSGGEALRWLRDGMADVLVTGEMNHHQCAEARDRGLAVVLAGHHASEVIVCPRLAKWITAEAENKNLAIEALVSSAEVPPVRRI